MALSSSEKRLRAQLAADTRWANTADRREATAPARAASPSSLSYWLERVPDEIVGDAERRAAAKNARRAHYRRLALASAKARRQAAEARAEADEAAELAELVEGAGDAA